MGYRIVTLLLSVLLLWAGPGFASQDSIVYRLKWLANMSTVGDLYASAHGYFGEQKLNVTIKPGGPERDAIRELELGYAQFGVASADQIIRALAKGAPVVVVAQLFQANPLQWIYRSNGKAIDDLADLRGLTLGVTFGKNDEIIMRTLLARARINIDKVRLYSVRLDYAPFFKGIVDLWPVYVNTQGVEIGAKLRSAGEQVRFFDPGQYGVRFVANSVVTSQQMIQRQPAVVRGFVRALLKGWRESMKSENGAAAVAVVRSYDRDSTLQILEKQLQATRALIQPGPQSLIGAIDRAAWQQTEDIMLQHHQITRPVRVVEHLKLDMLP